MAGGVRQAVLVRLNPRVVTPAADWLGAREWREAGIEVAEAPAFLRAPAAVKLEGLEAAERTELARRTSSGEVVLREGAQGRARPVILAGPRAALYDLAQDLANSEAADVAAALRAVLKADERRTFVLSLPGRPAGLPGRSLRLGIGRPLLMGIVNVTPDSFSDGGRFLDPAAAVAQGLALEAAGADLIDVGGESTRPGAAPVDEADELARVMPVVEALVQEAAVPVSIDTSKAGVARRCVAAGAAMINDVTALAGDPQMAETAAALGVPVCLMHMQGTPRSMQRHPQYDDLMGEIIRFLRRALARGLAAGIAEDAFIVDPGIGFGKTVEHNLAILNRLGQLRSLGRPVLVGPSRKSFIGRVLAQGGEPRPADRRLFGTAASVAVALMNGAHIVRVHDVAPMRDVAAVVCAIAEERLEN